MNKRIENLLPTLIMMLALWAPASMSAQTGINSPYSRYGLGVLSDNSTGIAKSMGGIGAGFRMPNKMNLKNPASYSSVDTLTFIADLGFTLNFSNFQENGVKVNANNAYMDHMAMQFRILPRVGVTLGIMPFSNVGYSFSKKEVVRIDEDGVITSTGASSGTGGVRQFMGGFGWRPADWLSVGMNASYLTGDITRQTSETFSTSAIQSASRTYTAQMSALKLDFGIQGTVCLGKNTLVLGATFAPSQELESNCSRIDEGFNSDTLSVPDAFRLPELVSAGFTYKWKNRMIGADVSYQTWSKAKFFGEEYGEDRLSASAGYMVLPDETSKSLLKRTSYQFGAKFSQPYFNIGGKSGPLEFGVTAGFSMPITSSYNSMSFLHVSGEYVRVQPMEKGMIVENCLRLNIGVSFMERWFMKWMVD